MKMKDEIVAKNNELQKCKIHDRNPQDSMKICSVIYARILIIEESTSRIFTLKHRRSYETKHS